MSLSLRSSRGRSRRRRRRNCRRAGGAAEDGPEAGDDCAVRAGLAAEVVCSCRSELDRENSRIGSGPEGTGRWRWTGRFARWPRRRSIGSACGEFAGPVARSEEHTSELPVTNAHLVCRLLLEKNKKHYTVHIHKIQ